MSKQTKKSISRQKVEPVSVTSKDDLNKPITPLHKVHVPVKPKPKRKKTMLKRILGSKIIKGILSLLGGAVGFTGSIFVGLDPEFAFLVAVTAIVAVSSGMDKAAKFKGLFDDELNKNHKP